MRLFDITGILFVSLWIVSVGAFVMIADDEANRGIPLSDGAIDLQEETLWMAVYRDGEETGVLREDRTRLIDGWLIELQGIIELDMMGAGYAFRFSSRTTLDDELTLRSATGDIEAFGMELNMNGRLRDTDDGPEFHVNISLDDSTRQFIAKLQQRPRLATHAIAEILATEQLEAGDRFQQEFFDPLTLSPTDLDITYEGRQQIDTVEGTYNSYEFVQSVGQFETRIFADSRGRILSQALPMNVVARQIPAQIGPSQFRETEERLEDQIAESPPFFQALDTEDLLSMVARFGTGEIDRLQPADDLDALASDDDQQSRQYAIDPIDDAGPLDLVTPDQHLAIQTSDRARVEAGADNPLWNPAYAPDNSNYQPVTSPEDHPGVAELASAIGEAFDTHDKPLEYASIAGAIADFCPDETIDHQVDITELVWPDELASTPSNPVDCVAGVADALTASDHRPHLVHGTLIDADDTPHPHLWLAIYRDGQYRGTIDPVAGDAPSSRHLQLFLDDAYAPLRLGGLVDSVQPN